MLIASPWIITLGDVPLLLATDQIDGELQGPTRAVTYAERRPCRATYADRYARGLSTHTLSFTRVREFGSVPAAQAFAFAHAAALPVEPATLTIEAVNGGKWTLSRATLGPLVPTNDAQLYRATYAITGSQLIEVTAPPVSFDSPDHTFDANELTFDSP